MSDISDVFKNLRDKRKDKDKTFKKIFESIDKAELFEQKGKFFDAADLYEKAAKDAEKTDDKELQNQLLAKIEECMVKGEEKREKLDKMFSI
ncbi:MAG: hypothetical protein HWN67_08440 [Candidatus Helarchaeota archaeon]|nr:hypothetical protein [Candidatus Helarchaeota archaeon]